MKYPIIVGTDLTEAADDALIQAEARAARDEVPLTVVHALSPLLWGAVNDADHVDRIRALIRKQFSALTGRRETEYEVVVERGLAHVVLARLAISQQALLVIGSHMHHGIGHALLKDVTERVLARARGPVLVTRPCNASNRVLVAVDQAFSRSAALEAAIDEARSSESQLTVLHAIDTGFMQTIAVDLFNGGAYADHPLGQGSRVSEARKELRAELRNRRCDADICVLEGEAESLIPQVAARIDAELVVIGTAHRPTRTSHVTTAVLRHAPCSVLVVDDSAAVATHPALEAAAG
jgi:nucleotide-binding universal stress UspA family protein